MPNTFPLIQRQPRDPIAFLTRPVEEIGFPAGTINAAQFVSHVQQVAAALADDGYAINLCGNRYLFLVGLCAAVLRGHTTLLPPNHNVATQYKLSEEYSRCYVIHDGGDTHAELPSVNLLSIPFQMTSETDYIHIPRINNDFLACISFTSGSTGHSKPNLKYWRTLHRSSSINYAFMIPDCDTTLYQLATMPAQHMWGLETSALLPLFSPVCMSDAKPLFPQDIIDTFSSLPEPRQLVSTPVHLRALCASMQAPLSAHSVLCATSPLTVELAKTVEEKFSAPLREVYGCSEVGSMAVRRTATEKAWLKFTGIDFHQNGEVTTAEAAHLPGPTELQDVIELQGDNRFVLAGRASDLVKIAGKRGSLFDINQTLLTFDGLEDGIVIHPAAAGQTTRLVAIVALKTGVEKSDLLTFLKRRLDSAFVPRPIYVVDALPREPNGKLLRMHIDALHASLKKQR
ncbi:AMP-binding protein [Aestuariibacter sp. A3R04]|uniref:AMP-binding protein n=1 Tax=Aestuariibacter sp. A3R04 TaxID=2841571 RepID=UPI001C096834|nr:AMP-binding protein [Aestuariibacter sp. A3R04]MBU3020482.1 AMP-binding protein [Aestuariibacter sp. A3R04]